MNFSKFFFRAFFVLSYCLTLSSFFYPTSFYVRTPTPRFTSTSVNYIITGALWLLVLSQFVSITEVLALRSKRSKNMSNHFQNWSLILLLIESNKSLFKIKQLVKIQNHNFKYLIVNNLSNDFQFFSIKKWVSKF